MKTTKTMCKPKEVLLFQSFENVSLFLLLAFSLTLDQGSKNVA